MAERCSEKNATAVVFRWLRALLYTLVVGLVVAVVGGLIVTKWFDPGPADTGDCDNPNVRINFPVEGYGANDVVNVRGAFDCVPAKGTLWITVSPPMGTPFGIHPTETTVVDGQHLFEGIAVLNSGLGQYQICTALADPDARQTFETVLEQSPPVGLSSLPPSAILRPCIPVIIR